MTPETLRQHLRYEPDTGLLFWVKRRKGRYFDKPVGAKMSHGYLAVGIDGLNFTAHRIAWALVHGKWPDGVIDHINGDRSDNRICNLRDVDQVKNMLNVHRPRVDNACGVRGVSLHRQSGKYTARLKSEGKYLSLGLYKTPEEAGEAYVAAKRAFGYMP